ncbi:MAG TPA: protein kinase [Kofleriaceae bacterium]|nr:protein kinase [Kofleriaceae bacterium]
MIDVLAALGHAHDARDKRNRRLLRVHRDVLPRNILMNRLGQPKLVDFGIARAQFQMHVTRTGIIKGTLPYMSPEQASDLPLDHRADLYSAAVVLYELVAAIRDAIRPVEPASAEQVVAFLNENAPQLMGLERAPSEAPARELSGPQTVVEGPAGRVTK